MLLNDILKKTPEQAEANIDDGANLPVITVFKDEDGIFGDDLESGYIIYCDIWNPSKEPLTVTIIESSIIKGEEKCSRDWFLTGYVVDDDIIIQPGTFVRRGEIYLAKNVGEIGPEWKYSITLANEDMGECYNAIFNRVSDDSWQQIKIDKIDPDKSNPM